MKLSSIYYNRDNNEFIINNEKSIIDRLCLLEHRNLYSIKFAYHIDPRGGIKHKMYEIVHSNFTGETFITLYKGQYPNIKIYKLDEKGCIVAVGHNFSNITISKNDNELLNLVKDIVINMYRFNKKYLADFYNSDIEILRGYLDVYCNRMLDIDLQYL